MLPPQKTTDEKHRYNGNRIPNTNIILFNAAKEKDPKHYLNDEQIAYLIEITKVNENETKVLEDLTRTEDNNIFKENDLRWLIFNLIMPDDENK